MWKWIEHTLEDSEDFNFLFAAGHYMTIDSRGIYDRSVISLNPSLLIIRYTGCTLKLRAVKLLFVIFGRLSYSFFCSNYGFG